VIFTTAYDQHALEAFETQAVGYLLKPVRQEKLARAIRHAARVGRTAQLLRSPNRSSSGRSARARSAPASASSCALIPVEDIYYFAAGQNTSPCATAAGGT